MPSGIWVILNKKTKLDSFHSLGGHSSNWGGAVDKQVTGMLEPRFSEGAFRKGPNSARMSRSFPNRLMLKPSLEGTWNQQNRRMLAGELGGCLFQPARVAQGGARFLGGGVAGAEAEKVVCPFNCCLEVTMPGVQRRIWEVSGYLDGHLSQSHQDVMRRS